MNENLDLIEILKDCPIGTKFYSSTFGNVEFLRIEKDDFINPIVIKWVKEEGNSYIEYLTKEGKFRGLGECIIFPSKDQRDWSKWQRPFVKGDVVSTTCGSNVFILNEPICGECGKYGKCFIGYDFSIDSIFKKGAYVFNRLATEEEKQKLFDVIKDKGYKWNPETKTLEKLIEPKFKVGDKIRHRLTGGVYKILFVLSNGYGGGVYDVAITNEIGKSIDVKEQDDYELVPNKFDPKTLQPFDKVLCRWDDGYVWGIDLFERYIPTTPYPFFCLHEHFNQCIPYNEETKYLVGKRDNAPEFYRYWEE